MRVLGALIASGAGMMMMGHAGVIGVPASGVVMQRHGSVAFQLMAQPRLHRRDALNGDREREQRENDQTGQAFQHWREVYRSLWTARHRFRFPGAGFAGL